MAATEGHQRRLPYLVIHRHRARLTVLITQCFHGPAKLANHRLGSLFATQQLADIQHSAGNIVQVAGLVDIDVKSQGFEPVDHALPIAAQPYQHQIRLILQQGLIIDFIVGANHRQGFCRCGEIAPGHGSGHLVPTTHGIHQLGQVRRHGDHPLGRALEHKLFTDIILNSDFCRHRGSTQCQQQCKQGSWHLRQSPVACPSTG